jgi:protein subunit release factor B
MRFGVTSGKEAALLRRMEELGVRESDLIEKFVRSRGKGGQHLNKSSTCVYLKHLSSGIEVKVDKDRFQGVNRFLARRLLLEKISRELFGLKTQSQMRADKIRKQKNRRARRAQKKC